MGNCGSHGAPCGVSRRDLMGFVSHLDRDAQRGRPIFRWPAHDRRVPVLIALRYLRPEKNAAPPFSLQLLRFGPNDDRRDEWMGACIRNSKPAFHLQGNSRSSSNGDNCEDKPLVFNAAGNPDLSQSHGPAVTPHAKKIPTTWSTLRSFSEMNLRGRFAPHARADESG
jgi:hypothetical protein